MRTIVYPIFLKVRDCTNDLFWKKIFENLAYGETPRGVYFKSDAPQKIIGKQSKTADLGKEKSLYSIMKKKEFNYNFTEDSAEQIYENLYSIFTKILGLKSKSDVSRKRELFEQFKQTNSARRSESLWGKLKKKSLKENLIHDYILRCKNKYNLPEPEYRKLYFYISVGYTFKLFSASDIILQNGSIELIQGITIRDERVFIDRAFEEPVIRKSSTNSVYLFELWNNYLKTL